MLFGLQLQAHSLNLHVHFPQSNSIVTLGFKVLTVV